MQKAFEDGAFALKVGEMSGGALSATRARLRVCGRNAAAALTRARAPGAVVDSDSGLHIILRTG
jgi:hypothetical protein